MYNYVILIRNGDWRSSVARLVRDQEAVGSNPASPTKQNDFYMSIFGHEWSEDYDAMEEYETSILHHED